MKPEVIKALQQALSAGATSFGHEAGAVNSAKATFSPINSARVLTSPVNSARVLVSSPTA